MQICSNMFKYIHPFDWKTQHDHGPRGFRWSFSNYHGLSQERLTELQDIGFIGESMDLMTHALGVWALRGSLHPGLTSSSDIKTTSCTW